MLAATTQAVYTVSPVIIMIFLLLLILSPIIFLVIAMKLLRLVLPRLTFVRFRTTQGGCYCFAGCCSDHIKEHIRDTPGLSHIRLETMEEAAQISLPLHLVAVKKMKKSGVHCVLVAKCDAVCQS